MRDGQISGFARTYVFQSTQLNIGVHREKQKQKLQDVDNEDHSSLAEASRPFLQLKHDIKDKNRDKHTQGRKPTKIQKTAERMNWLQPVVWAQIEAAAQRAGKPWRPVEITRVAKQSNPQLFEGLTSQVLGRWIDSEVQVHGKHKWRDSVLEKVKRGNAPGGGTTRRGILVSAKSVSNKRV